MNTVERIKEECKKRKIPVSKLERDCGFANGYISGLKRGVMPYDRLSKVADYFDVTEDFLMTGKEPAATIEGGFSDISQLLRYDYLIGDNDDLKYIIEIMSKWHPKHIAKIRKKVEELNEFIGGES